MQSAWARAVHWLAVNAPASAQVLGGPATDEDIAGLREALGFEVPDVLDELLRMNNGSTAKDVMRSFPSGRVVPVRHRDAAIFPDGKILLGSTEIAKEYVKWRRTEEENGLDGYWSACWVPVVTGL